MGQNWNVEIKRGLPPCGLYLSIKSSDFGVANEKKAMDMIRDLRMAIQAINTAPYEKNAHVIEFIIDGDKADGKKIAEGLRLITAGGGIVYFIRDDVDIAKEIKADGVFITDVEKYKNAREVLGEDGIVAVAIDDIKDINVDMDLIRLTGGLNINDLMKLKVVNPDYTILPSVKGLTNDNCSSFVKAGADFLDVSEYVWDHEEGVSKAVVNMLYAIDLSLDDISVS